MTAPPPTIPGYELEGVLGAGGMGQVYRARDTQLDRVVAVKVLRHSGLTPTARDRFEREVKVVVEKPHPTLVPIYDADVEHRPPYVVFALMEGGSLEDRMRRGGLAEAEVVALGARLAAGLEHLHAHGVLHRDLKPGNVLLDARGEPYLADLGLVLDADASEDLTRTGHLVGTPWYMAPELFEGGEYSARSDLFALGMTLLEATRGAKAGGDFATRHRDLVDATREVRHPELRRILRHLLHREPGDRVASAAEVRELLEACALEVTGEGLAPGGDPRLLAGAETREVAAPGGRGARSLRREELVFFLSLLPALWVVGQKVALLRPPPPAAAVAAPAPAGEGRAPLEVPARFPFEVAVVSPPEGPRRLEGWSRAPVPWLGFVLLLDEGDLAGEVAELRGDAYFLAARVDWRRGGDLARREVHVWGRSGGVKWRLRLAGEEARREVEIAYVGSPWGIFRVGGDALAVSLFDGRVRHRAPVPRGKTPRIVGEVLVFE